MLRGREPSRFHMVIRATIALGGVLPLFLQLLPAGVQYQAPWLALLLPVHAALAFPVRRT
jgi:hypothetical protein